MKKSVTIHSDDRHEARQNIIDEVFALIRQDYILFCKNNKVVQIVRGEVWPCQIMDIICYLNKSIRWTRYNKKEKTYLSIDAPRFVASGIYRQGKDFLPRLTAVITAPISDSKTGRRIEKEGYDEQSGFFLVPKQTLPNPSN